MITILRSLFPLAMLTLMGLIAYLNSLPNSFHFDDYDAIVNNPAIRDLKHLPSYFSDTRTWTMSTARDWRPLVAATFALNYWVGKLDPTTFRLFNLSLHIGVAFFLYLIFKDLAGRTAAQLSDLSPKAVTWVAMFAAGLFLVHTANSEVVNYIFARSTLQATFFYVVAFYCYLRGPFGWQQEATGAWHAGAALSFILSLCSKGSAISLPLVLAVFELIFLNPMRQSPWKLFWNNPGRLKKYVLCALVFLVYIVARHSFTARLLQIGRETSRPRIPALDYLFTQFRAWVYYMSLFLWPDPLIPDYPGFGWSRSFWDPGVLLSLALVLIILGMAWRLRKAIPIISFFMFWYFILLLPEASFIPLVDPVNIYRPYPSNVGFSITAVLAVFLSIARMCKRRDGSIRWKCCVSATASIAALSLGTLIVLTDKHNEVWRDEGSLWSYIIDKDPTNVRAHVNLGAHLLYAGDYQRAGELFDKAVRLAPKDPYAALLRGNLYVALGRNAEALAEFNRLESYSTRVPHLYYDRGELFRKLGDRDKALADYRKALGLRPQYTDALYGLVTVLTERGEDQIAFDACVKANDIDPFDERGYRCTAAYHLRQNRNREALEIYHRAVARLPDSSGLWYDLGNVYEKLGLYKEAGDAFERASHLIRLAPPANVP